MSSPSTLSARLSIGFSYIGHSVMHIMIVLFMTVVLALEREWHIGYDELIRLWTLGAAMVGLGAPLAGWLGDRWSDSRMMVVFFLLTGGGAIAAGLADGPTALMVGLAVLGLGASIYHPVGMSWLVKNAVNRGQALGIQGIFGSVGVASAGLVAGGLTELIHWRAAFLVPGAVSVALGIALAVCVTLGLVVDRKADIRPQPKVSRSDVLRSFAALSVTMLCTGLIFNALQALIPKWFGESLSGLVGGGTLGIGGLVTLVYLIAGLPQFFGGYLADRLPLRRLYAVCLLIQVPMMALAASLAGWPVVALAVVMASISNLGQPIENLLLSRFTPDRYRGLAFGAKFILSFGAGPVAVQMIALFYGWTGNFHALLLTLGGLAAVACTAALLLPDDRRDAMPVATAPAAQPAGGGN